jgi:hypothetical protein
VQGVLAGNCITISNAAGSGTKVILEDGPSITDYYGDPNVTDCQLPANDLNPGEVRVTLCIDLAATRLCDPLQAFGFSLIDCRLHASAVVKREDLP